MKLDNFLILLADYFVDYSLLTTQLTPVLHPGSKQADSNQAVTSSSTLFVILRMQQSGCPSQTSTVPKLLSAYSESRVSRLNSIVSVSYGPYITIWYPVLSSSGWIADSTIQPLSGFGQIVQIRIW